MDNNGGLREVVLPVECRRAGGVGGPAPQGSLSQATGGHSVATVLTGEDFGGQERTAALPSPFP